MGINPDKKCQYKDKCHVYSNGIIIDDEFRKQTCNQIYEGTHEDRPIVNNDSCDTCPVWNVHEHYQAKLDDITKIVQVEIWRRTHDLEKILESVGVKNETNS